MHPKHPSRSPAAAKQVVAPLGDAPSVAAGTAPPLSAAIKKKRGDRSIRDVARELGEAHPNIQKAETGAIPRPALFLKLMVWLDVLDEPTAAKLRAYAE